MASSCACSADVNSSPSRVRPPAAFGKLCKLLAAKYKLDYIFVDMGPHTDLMHQV